MGHKRLLFILVVHSPKVVSDYLNQSTERECFAVKLSEVILQYRLIY